MKIDELKESWLNYLIARGRGNGTKKAYEDELNKFINYLTSLDITDIHLITTEILENYLFNYPNVSTNTKAWKMRPIKGFFKFLFRREYIRSNPAANLESIKISQKRAEYLSEEEYTRFFQIVGKTTPYYRERDLMIVRLLVKTGLRKSELTGLNISDVDLSKLHFRVRRKGGREEYLILHHELVEDLQKYLKTINRGPDEPLFISKRNKRLSPSSVWHLIKKYSKKAGLNCNVTTHSLRHTFATTLLSNDMPLPYIQELMGHRSPQTTSRYLHVQNSKLVERFNRVTFEEGR